MSPFVSLPTATTLPYTYKTLGSSLPPSITVDSKGSEKARYVVSASGHAAHPDEINASCHTLHAHLRKLKDDGDRTIREWEESIRERELAEKRRVAPGWLDREEKILEPTRAGPQKSIMDSDSQDVKSAGMADAMSPTREGEDLDRAFGSLGVK